MPQSTSILIAAAIAFAGCIPLLIALYKNNRIKHLKATGHPTTGLVEQVYQRQGLKGNTYYQALISFSTGTSIQRHYYPFAASHTGILAKGNRVTIIYNPDKPKRFIITEIPQSKALTIITTIIAVAYIVISFLLYDFMRQ